MSEPSDDSAEGVTSVRLPKALYGEWAALAKRQRESAPNFLQRVMRAVLKRDGGSAGTPEDESEGTSGKLSITLSPAELVEQVRAAAQSEGRSISGWMAIAAQERLGKLSAPAATDYVGAVRKKVDVRLTEAEKMAAVAQATAEGYKLSPWLSALIRARLRSRPIFTVAELEGLSEATLQLAAVGRNLNSAVYRLQREDRWYGTSMELADLHRVVKVTTDAMNAVIERAAERGRF